MPQPFLELNAEVTEAALRRLGERLAAGKIKLAVFEARAAEEIRSGAVASFRFAAGGPLNTKQTKILNSVLSEQSAYFRRFVAGVKDGSVPLTSVANRATLYTNAVTQAEAYGVLTRDGVTRIRWDAIHDKGICETCSAMAGEHDAVKLLKGGVTPGHGTDCGPRCRCKLTPVKAAA